MILGERRRRVPKAELHCHIEGTAAPALVAELAAREGMDVTAILSGETYSWQGFTGFLAAYDLAASVFRRPDDYRRLAFDHLSRLAGEGALYAEIFVSPDHARRAGLPPADYLDALATGIMAAEREHGIVARMIVTGVRHFGPDAVEAAARLACASGHRLVTGFGLAGDERIGRPADFARAFDIAREAGLGLTAHAGEFAGAPAIRETLDALKVSRLGHGVRAVEDGALVDRLRAEGIVLEVCPLSNLALGVHGSPTGHPLRRLKDAGCRVTLNSDDPPFFATSLAREYDFAAEHQGFSEGELVAATRTAIEAAFLDGETRGRLLERLVASALSLGAAGTSV